MVEISPNLFSDISKKHQWGFADTHFIINDDLTVTLTGDRYDLSGYQMPYLLAHVQQELGIEIELGNYRQEIAPKFIDSPSLDRDFCQAVSQLFPAHQYTVDDVERLLHSHGQNAFDEVYQVLYDRLKRTIDMVFYCESESDAQQLIELAIEHNVCLIPFGGGTNVSCALKLPERETRMMIAVDIRRMNRVEWIDTKNLQACVQAGITGKQLEEILQAKGFTCGHEPDSLEFSTLGGWIATNASGMKKNRYGNIENIVENITMITPSGVLAQSQGLPRVAMGLQSQTLLFGSEGNLGLITKATIKIYPLPQLKQYGSIVFPNFELGVQFLDRLAHSGCLPASIRLVDNNQFRFGQVLKPKMIGFKGTIDRLKKLYLLKLKGFQPDRMVAATLVMEGTDREVAYQQQHIYTLAKQFQGLPAGAENGRRGYMLTYAIAYIRDFFFTLDILGESFETSVPWDKIHQVCASVTADFQAQHQQYNLPGKPYLSYRISQTYHTGVCLYFMMGVYTKGVANPAKICSKIEHHLRKTIIENGGSISHHHGVGKIRHEFIQDTQSVASIKLLSNIKQTTDPQNIFGIGNNICADE